MRKLSVMLPLCLLAAVSCNKTYDPPKEKIEHFTVDEVGYETLQEAVNAVAAFGSDGTATITMIADNEGDGAVLPKGCYLDVELDLGDFTYTLNPGHSINATNNSITLVGDGGAILSRSDEPALIAAEGTLVTISGDFDINAETAIITSSPVIVTDDFSGHISGNIQLQGAEFQLYSPNCTIEVPLLTAQGENAVFSVDVIGERKSGGPVATIGQVVSDQQIPVTACSAKDVTVEHGGLHVHSFEKESYTGTCIIRGGEYLVCSECGYHKAWSYSETEYGNCDALAFIHHPAVAAQVNEFGNVEYYECPLCGRYFLDSRGTKEAVDGILIVPTNFGDLDSLFDPNLEPKPFPAFDVASLIITNALTLGFFFKSLIDQLETQRLFKEITDKLKVISAKLEDITIRMSSLLFNVNILPYKFKIQDRMSRLNQLQLQTISSMIAIDSIARKRPDLTAAQKEAKIKEVLVDWSGTKSVEKSLHPQEELFSLMKEATTNSTGPNIPQMYSEIIAAQPTVLWEHESYELAVAMLTYDVNIITALYICAGYFNNALRTYCTEDAKTEYMKLMKETYREYSKAFTDEHKRLAHRDSVYRRYMPANVTYHKSMDTEYDPYGYFANMNGKCWFPRGNDNYDAQKYCYEVMDYKRSKKSKYGASTRCLHYMDASVAKDIYEKYKAMAKARGDKKEISVYEILKNAGFKDYPSSNWKLILDRDRSWGLDKPGDYEFPHCWVFYWRSFKGSYGYDYLGIRTVMKKDGGTEEVKLLKSCNIEVPSGKMTKINRNDDVKDYKYSTIVVAGTGDKITK